MDIIDTQLSYQQGGLTGGMASAIILYRYETTVTLVHGLGRRQGNALVSSLVSLQHDSRRIVLLPLSCAAMPWERKETGSLRRVDWRKRRKRGIHSSGLKQLLFRPALLSSLSS